MSKNLQQNLRNIIGTLIKSIRLLKCIDVWYVLACRWDHEITRGRWRSLSPEGALSSSSSNFHSNPIPFLWACERFVNLRHWSSFSRTTRDCWTLRCRCELCTDLVDVAFLLSLGHAQESVLTGCMAFLTFMAAFKDTGPVTRDTVFHAHHAALAGLPCLLPIVELVLVVNKRKRMERACMYRSVACCIWIFFICFWFPWSC